MEIYIIIPIVSAIILTGAQDLIANLHAVDREPAVVRPGITTSDSHVWI